MSNTDFPLSGEDDINFHFENVAFDFSNGPILTSWVKSTISSKKKKLGFLNFIFCNDKYLHGLNVEYLDHDTLTDVITFSYSDDTIEGDIFISIDRVQENANELKVSFTNELHRVMIHGLLHLLGFKDKTKEEKETMTKNENECLVVLDKMILDKN